MRQALAEFHPDFAYHEQPGAGHWWGNPCVDWPPLFAFLADHKIPAVDQVRKIDFITASPAVSSRAHWLSIESQLKALLPSKVHLELDPEHRRFSRHDRKCRHGWRSTWDALCPMRRHPDPIQIELDGQKMPAVFRGSARSDGNRSVWLVRTGGTWSLEPVAAASVPKRPSPPGSVQGSVSQSVRSRLRHKRDSRGECVVARPGAVRRRDVLVPGQRLGRHRLGCRLSSIPDASKSFATAT